MVDVTYIVKDARVSDNSFDLIVEVVLPNGVTRYLSWGVGKDFFVVCNNENEAIVLLKGAFENSIRQIYNARVVEGKINFDTITQSIKDKPQIITL